eukprot:gene17964-biopygen9869
MDGRTQGYHGQGGEHNLTQSPGGPLAARGGLLAAFGGLPGDGAAWLSRRVLLGDLKATLLAARWRPAGGPLAARWRPAWAIWRPAGGPPWRFGGPLAARRDSGGPGGRGGPRWRPWRPSGGLPGGPGGLLAAQSTLSSSSPPPSSSSSSSSPPP